MNIIVAVTEQTEPSQCYRVTYDDTTVAFVPNDSLNKDYVSIQQWVAAGGTITILS